MAKHVDIGATFVDTDGKPLTEDERAAAVRQLAEWREAARAGGWRSDPLPVSTTARNPGPFADILRIDRYRYVVVRARPPASPLQAWRDLMRALTDAAGAYCDDCANGRQHRCISREVKEAVRAFRESGARAAIEAALPVA